jgi:hypothetical protein
MGGAIMIDITRAQANQTTRNGINEDWVVTLEEELIYTLPAHFTVEETFKVRGIIEQMMKLTADEVKEQEQQLSLIKMQHVASKGDAKLDALKRENERLAILLETEIGEAA